MKQPGTLNGNTFSSNGDNYRVEEKHSVRSREIGDGITEEYNHTTRVAYSETGNRAGTIHSGNTGNSFFLETNNRSVGGHNSGFEAEIKTHSHPELNVDPVSQAKEWYKNTFNYERSELQKSFIEITKTDNVILAMWIACEPDKAREYCLNVLTAKP